MTGGAYLFVDGYNIINSWATLNSLKDTDLGHARDKLVDVLANYAAFKGCEVTVVFDAYAVKKEVSIESRTDIRIVFTGADQTADSYIEKAAYDLLAKKRKVFVVTGDYSEQQVILGMGAYRMTAKELFEDCFIVCKDIIETIEAGRPLAGRREVAGLLGIDVINKLEQLRRKKQK